MEFKKITHLYNQYAVPGHIRKHMEMVAKVALIIGKSINKKQNRPVVDVKLVQKAALLHDLFKICEFSLSDPLFLNNEYSNHCKNIWRKMINEYSAKGHIKAAAEVLKRMGETKIANLILKHDYECVIDNNKTNRPNTLEEKIIYYADKRVLHDRIVDLAFRFEDGKRRYAKEKISSEKRAEIEKCAFEIEKELCRQAGIAPSELVQLVVKSQ